MSCRLLSLSAKLEFEAKLASERSARITAGLQVLSQKKFTPPGELLTGYLASDLAHIPNQTCRSFQPSSGMEAERHA